MHNQYKIRQFKCLGCGRIVKAQRAINKTSYCSLECWRKSKRPQRKTGKTIICEWCSKKVYKQKVHLKHKHHFCSLKCANKYQTRNKIKFICKICGGKFEWSKSRIKNNNPLYCSWKCRLEDKEHIFKNAIKGNLIQQNKKGLNKLELTGQNILKDIGVKFNEQVLMFNKFLVDVLIPEKNIVIQWDGYYWHTKPKRIKLDKSQDAYLTKCGYKVLRITDQDIKNNKEQIYANITRAIQ